ncbi:MAG: isoleucine--tRNA ligase, partial [Chloroflexota bacterium]|nr:isoleucine--tRNA ligase [Chloroflexota bacterium]
MTSKVSFPKLEEEVLRLWQEKNVFERSVEQRQGKPRFILYEGPPTANARPGIHHVLARVFKDIIPRYKTMKGYYAPRRGGWDTHGLPVELEVERKLGFSSKRQIEEYGVGRFNQLCRDSVFSYVKDWEALTARIGFWVDMEHAYITLDNDYIETGWWILKQLWEKGLIYQGSKVTPHCPRCGTTLSSHEVALGYKDDAVDPSIYIKFKLDLQRGGGTDGARHLLASPVSTYLLAWTTTPWTLPGNTALAVGPQVDYALVEYQAGEGRRERFILAQALLPQALKHEYEIVATIKGEELRGLQYEPLFDPREFAPAIERFQPSSFDSSRVEPQTVFRKGSSGPEGSWPSHEPLSFPVITGDFVSTQEGTGIVHIAPAFGEVDYEAGRENQLYMVQQVDLEGKITGAYPFAGKFVKEADPLVLDDLKSRGLLYRSEKITHTYPFCWRCSSPLLYYAKSSWYIRTTAHKKDLIAGNEQINWYPEHIKRGRFGDWLENNVDWAFSRERYWGTPVPVWRCQGCGHWECIGSRDELRRMAHHEAMAKEGHTIDECLKDLHRPFVDDIILKCPKSGPGGETHYPDTMRRVPEVMDCWFDSGAMPFAQAHYPFENKDRFTPELFPADYICEAVDQTRGWFYSLHAISTLLRNEPSFKNVICLGHILD